jgi:hypothetical protein
MEASVDGAHAGNHRCGRFAVSERAERFFDRGAAVIG